jgi:hypothetical protein
MSIASATALRSPGYSAHRCAEHSGVVPECRCGGRHRHSALRHEARRRVSQDIGRCPRGELELCRCGLPHPVTPIRETYPIAHRRGEDRCLSTLFDVSVEMLPQLLEHRSRDLDNTGPVCLGVLLDESSPVLARTWSWIPKLPAADVTIRPTLASAPNHKVRPKVRPAAKVSAMSHPPPY